MAKPKLTDAERRQNAINSLASAYVQAGTHKDMTAAQQQAEKEIQALADQNIGKTKLRLGKTDQDFFDGAASELLSNFRTKKAPKANARKSVTGKPVTPSPTTKDGQYSRDGVWVQESNAKEGEKQAGTNPSSSVPTSWVDAINSTNAANAQNSQKTEQTDRIVETAKENLKGVPGALTGNDSEEDDNNSGTGSGGGGGKDPEDPPKAPNRYYSVWDAYWKGAFGEPGSKEAKGAAAYYTVDAIANYFKNLSKGIGNIGAQFSGGTVDTSDDTPSEWQKAMNVMNEEQRELWGEQQGGQRTRNAKAQNADIYAKELANARTWSQNQIVEYAAKKFKEVDDPAWKIFYGMLARGEADAIGAVQNGTIMDFLDNLMKKQGKK